MYELVPPLTTKDTDIDIIAVVMIVAIIVT